jgi:hypothetical protein
VELGICENFEIIARQSKLKKLLLMPTKNFNALPVNEELQVIDLDLDLSFFGMNLLAMKNLEDFLKTQKKIKSLGLSFSSEYNFNGNLTHILNLETLRSLVIHRVEIIDFLTDDVRNNNVQKIVIKSNRRMPINFAKFVRSFPNTKSFQFDMFDGYMSGEETLLINNLKFLEELVIGHSFGVFEIAEELQLPNLKKIEIDSIVENNPESFKPKLSQFIKNHPNIEELKLNISGIEGSMIDLELLELVLGNLKNLKKLSIYIKLDDFHTAIVEMCELIKKHATTLSDLELKFGDNQTDVKTVKTMVENYFQNVLPNLKINYIYYCRIQ